MRILILPVLVLISLTTGCYEAPQRVINKTKPTQVINLDSGRTVYLYTFDGHRWIVLESSYSAQILHHPDCCALKEDPT